MVAALAAIAEGVSIAAMHRHLTTYQLGRQAGQLIVLILCPEILDRHIPALDVAAFADACSECGNDMRPFDRR